MTFGVFYKNKSSFTPTQQLQAFLSTQHNKQTTNTKTPNLVLTPTDSIQQRTKISDFKPVKSSYKRMSLSELIEDSLMFHTFMAHLATGTIFHFTYHFLYTFAKIQICFNIFF